MDDPIRRAQRAFSTTAAGYLNTPSMGIPPKGVVAAIEQALSSWSAATARFEDWDATYEHCRALIASEVGAAEQNVALIPSVVPAVSYVSAQLARRGGVLLAHRSEFRSLLLPAMQAYGEDRVRWVDGPYGAATFTDALERDVSAVVASTVSSHDGSRIDLPALLRACDDVGAELIVDATQSLGVIALDVPVDRPAAMVAAGYKGLLAPRGTGYGIIRPDLTDDVPMQPSPYGMADTAAIGSYGPPLLPFSGAARLDQSPAWLSWIGARAGLEFLGGVPVAAREEHALRLAGRLRARLADAGLPVVEGDLPSPVVSVAVDTPDDVLARLDRAGVRASVRRGRLRMGFHLYVAEETVDTAFEVLVQPDR
ncbi:aminotransferase class V-fold PLP-dependent enzyme [Phytoactinopolyspora limicola]|uniref:aminotransferase class V-fold PLP-dependent enzyme n=1 Tax=Phytoactinopolyspora limicola TaxID=2715536 RepID=UPI001408160B|nr:aminotransferase class V-fold PLP-dependent enzyme [Phytoactinopolyspora limicola]